MRLALPLVLAFAGACHVTPPAPKEGSYIVGETGELGEFRLVDQDGLAFTKTSLRGSVWVVDFFYTSCPSACPRMSREMVKLQREFEAENVRFLSISVDPKRDTPAVLKKYGQDLGAREGKWYFLTGSIDTVQALQRQAANEADPEEPTHSQQFFLADENGYLRGFYKPTNPDDLAVLKRDLRRLLKDDTRPL